MVRETVELDVKCKVEYIDFEGRSDGHSLLKIVKQMNPHEVILVRGDAEATRRFAAGIKQATSRKNKDTIEVFTPLVNQVIDTTKQRHIYQVLRTHSAHFFPFKRQLSYQFSKVFVWYLKGNSGKYVKKNIPRSLF